MKATDILTDVAKKSREEQANREELKLLRTAQLKRELDEAKSEISNLQSALNIMGGLADADIQPLSITANPGGKGGEATAIALASDWHVFETVKKSEVNGLNEFNVTIAQKSIETFFQKIAQLADIERGAVRVDNLVLALLGDLMTNQLHRDQVETGAGTPMEEVLFLIELITGGIDFLLTQNFKLIQLPCCDGNHGRSTEKIQHSNRVKHSYEWMLYTLLAKHYANDPRVQFNISEGQLLYTELYGRTLRWTHGDALQYNGGVGGLTIPVRKAIAEWDKGRRADMTFFGHWHTSHLDKHFCANSSVVGYAPYSVRIKAAYEPPQQAFLLFDEQRGLSAYRPIYVR